LTVSGKLICRSQLSTFSLAAGVHADVEFSAKVASAFESSRTRP